MIRVDRAKMPEPGVLSSPYTRGKKKGKTELELVIAALEEHQGADADFSFPFERYKEDPVKVTLEKLFHGKCAYCETFYSASQPMDVEHWRPKGEVHLDDGTVLKPGYYWLAATWHNLLPSCIDCNRSRTQHDMEVDDRVTIGKANQFPLAPGRSHARGHHPEPDLAAESALLVNPCEDDPERFFAFTDDGVMTPADGLSERDRARARASIRVYALNRSGLVAERKELVLRIDHRMKVLGKLAELRDDLVARSEPELARIAEDLISFEADALHDMKKPSAPFAGLARFILGDAERGGSLPPRSPNREA